MGRTVRFGLSLALVAGIFVFALPKIADVSDVWGHVRAMTWLEVATLLALALWNIVTYWFVMISSLPGSNVWQTMKINQASTAVANTLPGGGAIAIAVTYGMYSAYGFDRSQIGLSVLISGIWNNFVKLGMPVLALGFLALQGNVGAGLMTASLAGLAALVVAIGLFAATLASERLARAIGSGMQKMVSVVRRVARSDRASDLQASTVEFRSRAITLVSRRWIQLTVTSIVSHVSLFLVLLVALRHVGVADTAVGWAEALAAFAFVRLISALPVTPGGLGVVELGLTAALVTAGGPEARVVAAVLVYRAVTYFLPIPFGLLMYARYKRGSAARKARLDAAVTARPAERPTS
jgi:uncharacterized protein (TIRG00374 family)